MNSVFLDTVGLIAIWERTDQWHQVATEAFERILANRVRIITTTYVLIECANSASRRPYRSFVDPMRNNLVELGGLVFPTDEDWQAVWDEYRTGKPGTPGIVDLMSFRVMRNRGLTDAFTNDRHFREAGFNPLF